MENGREVLSLRPERGKGYAALPVTALVSLGAEVGSRGDEVEVRIGDREIRFRTGSAEFTVDGAAHRMAFPVYTAGGVVFLPTQFFVEFLPGMGIPSVQVEPAARTLRLVRAAPSRAAAVSSSEARTTPATEARGEAAPSASPTGSSGPPVERPAPPAGSPAPGAERPAPPAPARRRLVVVDAGHGGVDPGALGPGGAREKTVTLAVARQLAALLREDSTFEVRMTRDQDTLIALRDRARMANRWRGEGQPALFISIHCNANTSRAARGFETYFLSEAKTEDARRVERMENEAQRYETDAAGRVDPLSFILQDLRQNKYLRDSNDWAAIIQEELQEVHPGPNRGVKQAGFYVLNGAFMPAVLVEIGFITNPVEEDVLTTPRHQRQIAEGLARSIRAFFGSGSARLADGAG